MVQKELKNKTKLYTIIAVLSALILVSAIYTVTTPTVMYGTLGISPMKHFESINDLKNYLTTNTIGYSYDVSIISGVDNFFTRPDTARGPVPDAAPISVPSPASGPPIPVTGPESTLSASIDYSKTNIQVVGVDEADVVKTDGKYIYTINRNYNSGFYGDSPSVQIVNADPNNPIVAGKITFDSQTYISGMYLSENGNKLAILGNTHQYGIMPLNEDVVSPSDSSEPVPTAAPRISLWPHNSATFIYVYDVSNKATPVLTRNVTLSGNYANSRMVGDYIYLIVNQPTYVDDEMVILPRISTDAVITEIAPTSIYYTDIQDTYFSYTLFNSINIMSDVEQPTSMTILMGASSCMYVSNDNMYVTFNKYESTELYRVSFNGANLSFKAQGTVPGYVLNQYSMDEYNDYFRIATTVSTGSWDNRVDYNNLYILNMNLNTVGKLEKLAEGERIFSARFAGDKAYLVTFEQIDPFFVLDLKNPTSPKVAGELKIPGFSNYLHPYNENYVIGLGQEDNAVKLSFFDVTDMNNPQEIAKYLIDENNASVSSEALYEPKAFLFDQQKQLLVIPISIAHYGHWEKPKPTPIPDKDGEQVIYDYGLWIAGDFWSGVYAFKVSPENGFTLQSKLSHKAPGSSQEWYSSVTRSLYIGNTLYTISNDMVQLNSLDNFRLIAQVTF